MSFFSKSNDKTQIKILDEVIKSQANYIEALQNKSDAFEGLSNTLQILVDNLQALTDEREKSLNIYVKWFEQITPKTFGTETERNEDATN